MGKLSKWLPNKSRTGRETGISHYMGETHPVLRMRDEMNKMFDSFFREPMIGFDLDWPRSSLSGGIAPNIDIEDKGQELKVSVELPGIDPDDVDVNLTDNSLTIKGEKKIEETEENEGYYMSERAYGAFQRSIPLPVEVESNRVKANFKKGVLTVLLPKSEKAREKIRKISVHSED
jgi:HSP20 family protein